MTGLRAGYLRRAFCRRFRPAGIGVVLGVGLAMTAPARGAAPTPAAQEILARLNDHRRRAGLRPARLGAERTAGAAAHARYLRLNVGQPWASGLAMHREVPGRPGYSRVGAAAAGASVISVRFGVTTDPIDDWMASFFHRIPLMHPALREVGFAEEEVGDARGTRILVLDVRPEGAIERLVIVPGNGARGVPRRFGGDELPNPIPQDPDGRAGYPITFTFPAKDVVRSVEATLQDQAGAPVRRWLSTPARPAHPQAQQNSIALIPHDPLAARTTYQARVTARVNGRAWTKTVTFTTE